MHFALYIRTAVLLLAIAGFAHGQSDSDPKEPPPEPEVVDLKTGDGVQLKATYYGSNLGNSAVPVILLHDYKGNRNELHSLAMSLQERGHAVIAPDLRGHGESTKVQLPGQARTVTIDAARMRRDDFLKIAVRKGDLETVKSFLLSENNAGKLNIQKLCVVGSGMSAVLATYWAVTDWNFNPVAGRKQGEDLQAIVLVSPEMNFQGIPITTALNHPDVQTKISMLIAVGKDKSTAVRDATRVHKLLERFHPEPPADEVREKKDLFMIELDTSLQGTSLLTRPSLKLDATIAQFIELRLVDKDFPWSDRSNP